MFKCLVVTDNGLSVKVKLLPLGRKVGFGGHIAFEIGYGQVLRDFKSEKLLIKRMVLGGDMDIYARPGIRESVRW